MEKYLDNILNYSFETYFLIIFIYIIVNIFLYIIFRKKNINKILFHKIFSIINILAELYIISIGLYQFHVLFIIFSPFIIMFITLLGYGINKELTDQDKAGLVRVRGFAFFISNNLRARFIELIYFPGYYLIESWRKGDL